MSRMTDFDGLVTPILTPFGENLSPDPDRYLVHARWLLANGCTGIAPFGTTGEASSLSVPERRALLQALVEGGIDPARLMPGVGTCSLSETVELMRFAGELGCGAVLLLPPFYYKAVVEEGLYRYVAEAIGRGGAKAPRVVLYHIPPVALVGYPLELVARLAEAFPEVVVGIKDSSGDGDHTRALLEQESERLAVFPGSEVVLRHAVGAGAAGCISAIGNVNPAGIRAAYEAATSGEGLAEQHWITAVRQTIEGRPVIPALKHLASVVHEDPAWRHIRPPFLEISEAEGTALVEALENEHAFRAPGRRAQASAAA